MVPTAGPKSGPIFKPQEEIRGLPSRMVLKGLVLRLPTVPKGLDKPWLGAHNQKINSKSNTNNGLLG